MSPHTTDMQPVIEGILEPDGVIHCRAVDRREGADRRSAWCGIRRPGCVDPTVLQALADESVLSLQISSEAVPGGPREEFSLKIERFLGTGRARGRSAPLGSAPEVPAATYIRFTTHRERGHPVRVLGI